MRRLKVEILLSIVIFFLGGTLLVESLELEGKIHKNVYIKDIDVSGLTKDEAKNKLKNILENNNEMGLKFYDNVYSLSLSEVGVEYKIDDLVKVAYEIGRDKDIISDIKTKIELDLGKKQIIDLKYSYNEERLKEYINNIDKKLSYNPVDASIKLVNGAIIVDKEKYGRKVDTKKLKKDIMYKIENIFDSTVDIDVAVVEPKYISSTLSKINTELGSYETYFNSKSLNRVNNIKVAADGTNNIIVDTDEEFSFNLATEKAGIIPQLKKAPVINNGKLEEGLGGGICQVSSTIYNAALYSGLEITSVRNHSIPSPYVEKGRDATVSSRELDFRFRNRFKTPIFIYNKVYENRIVSTIYGNKEDKKDIDVVTEIIKIIPSKVTLTDSKDLYEGQRSIKEKGRVGYKVNTFRIYKGKNTPIKEFIYESYYPPKDTIVINGIKRKEIYNNINLEVI